MCIFTFFGVAIIDRTPVVVKDNGDIIDDVMDGVEYVAVVISATVVNSKDVALRDGCWCCCRDGGDGNFLVTRPILRFPESSSLVTTIDSGVCGFDVVVDGSSNKCWIE